MKNTIYTIGTQVRIINNDANTSANDFITGTITNINANGQVTIQLDNQQTTIANIDDISVIDNIINNKGELSMTHSRLTARENTLKANGVDTSKYFSIELNNNLVNGDQIHVSIDDNGNIIINDNIDQMIVKDGFITEAGFRRWITAQTFRAYNSGDFDNYITDTHRGYAYQLTMMINEFNALNKASRNGDTKSINIRKEFFSKDTVVRILTDMVDDVQKYVYSLPVHKCKNKLDYINVYGAGRQYSKHDGHIWVDDIQSQIINPLLSLINKLRNADGSNYYYIASLLRDFQTNIPNMPHNQPKLKSWLDAYKAEGAYYALENIIATHGVKFESLDMYKSLELLEKIRVQLVNTGSLGKFYNIFCNTVKANNFDLAKSIEAQKNSK